jgi:hypothetical protein
MDPNPVDEWKIGADIFNRSDFRNGGIHHCRLHYIRIVAFADIPDQTVICDFDDDDERLVRHPDLDVPDFLRGIVFLTDRLPWRRVNLVSTCVDKLPDLTVIEGNPCRVVRPDLMQEAAGKKDTDDYEQSYDGQPPKKIPLMMIRLWISDHFPPRFTVSRYLPRMTPRQKVPFATFLQDPSARDPRSFLSDIYRSSNRKRPLHLHLVFWQLDWGLIITFEVDAAVNGKVYISGIEGFWSFAKERLMKYHGVNPNKFPLFLKELEFRHNQRQHDI